MAKEYVYEEVKNDLALLQSQILSDAITEIENSTLGELIEITDTIPNDTISVDSLLLQNQNITVNYLPEENLKTLNELLLLAEDGGFTGYDAVQLQTITDIASQCPLIGGNAVYIARAILANMYGEAGEYENDCANYNTGGGNRIQQQTRAHVEKTEADKIITRTDYYDLQGRFILTENISTKSEINLLNGIYLIKSYVGEEIISIQKIVIYK